MSKRSDVLVWCDLEMTGLDIHTCHILEVAFVITDYDLNVIAHAPTIAINQPAEILAGMDEWCTRVHGNSGLIEKCRLSQFNEAAAEEIIYEFLYKHSVEKTSPLCGNSVHQDRKFLLKYMPQVESYLNYRLFDVASFRISKSIWNLQPTYKFIPRRSHEALADIMESINEMKFYKNTLFSNTN